MQPGKRLTLSGAFWESPESQQHNASLRVRRIKNGAMLLANEIKPGLNAVFKGQMNPSREGALCVRPAFVRINAVRTSAGKRH